MGPWPVEQVEQCPRDGAALRPGGRRSPATSRKACCSRSRHLGLEGTPFRAHRYGSICARCKTIRFRRSPRKPRHSDRRAEDAHRDGQSCTWIESRWAASIPRQSQGRERRTSTLKKIDRRGRSCGLNEDGLPQMRDQPDVSPAPVKRGAGSPARKRAPTSATSSTPRCWLIKSVQVAAADGSTRWPRSIVNFQREFLDHGIEGSAVAGPARRRRRHRDARVHREPVVNDRYMHTPRACSR